jgi:hypothetical protein
MIDINWNPSRREIRQFCGIGLPLASLALGWLLLYRTGSWRTSVVIWIAGTLAGLLGTAAPGVGRGMFVTATAVAYPIGWVLSHVLLAAMFYLVFTPTGFIMRLMGRDPLKRNETSARTYWARHEPPTAPEAYFRQF